MYPSYHITCWYFWSRSKIGVVGLPPAHPPLVMAQCRPGTRCVPASEVQLPLPRAGRRGWGDNFKMHSGEKFDRIEIRMQQYVPYPNAPPSGQKEGGGGVWLSVRYPSLIISKKLQQNQSLCQRWQQCPFLGEGLNPNKREGANLRSLRCTLPSILILRLLPKHQMWSWWILLAYR